LAELVAKQPRLRLAHLPTPLEELPRLASYIGVERFFVKRDDLTGLAFGGNKVRNYEFRLAEVVADKPDALVLYVDALSNSQRQLAAACAQLGIATHLVLAGATSAPVTGNLLLSYLLGATVHFVANEAEQPVKAAQIQRQLADDGQKAVVLNDLPIFKLGSAFAYALAFLEIMEQLEAAGLDINSAHLYMSSTGKGQAGLELAKYSLGMSTTITGVASHDRGGAAREVVVTSTKEAAEALGIGITLVPGQIDNREQYSHDQWSGAPSPEGNQSLLVAAHYGGLFLDPLYNAKTMAAIIDDARAGVLRNHIPVLVHTGGLPLLFSFERELMNAVSTYDNESTETTGIAGSRIS